MSEVKSVVVTSTPYAWSNGPQASFFAESTGPYGATAYAKEMLRRSTEPYTEGYIEVWMGTVVKMDAEDFADE